MIDLAAIRDRVKRADACLLAEHDMDWRVMAEIVRKDVPALVAEIEGLRGEHRAILAQAIIEQAHGKRCPETVSAASCACWLSDAVKSLGRGGEQLTDLVEKSS